MIGICWWWFWLNASNIYFLQFLSEKPFSQCWETYCCEYKKDDDPDDPDDDPDDPDDPDDDPDDPSSLVVLPDCNLIISLLDRGWGGRRRKSGRFKVVVKGRCVFEIENFDMGSPYNLTFFKVKKKKQNTIDICISLL